MIRVTLGSRQIGVSFQRELQAITSNKFKHAPAIPVKATYCNLLLLDAEGKSTQILARSRVGAHSGDRYNLEEGRKRALKYVLKQYGLSRGERTLIWQTYHNRPRPVSIPKLKEEVPTIMEGSPSLTGITHADGFKDSQVHAHMDLNAGEM